MIVESEEDVAAEGEGDEHVRHLRQKKEELSKRKEQKLRDKENIQVVRQWWTPYCSITKHK